MADRTFRLEVVTPDRVVMSDKDIVSVVVPGTEGYLGVLADHAPLMSALAIGELEFRRADGSRDIMAVAGGFMEVFENTVTVLAEGAELGAEIDIARAEEAVRRAEERIAAHAAEVDMDRAATALKRAINRLSVARHRQGM